MYTKAEKDIAIRCLIKNEYQYIKTLTELEYPKSEYTLRRWYKEYQSGKTERKRRFSKEERLRAIQHYIENGRNFKKTVRELGYPSRTMLRKWLEEEKPGEYYPCQKKAANIHLSQSQKEQAAVDMRMKTKSSEEIAEKYNTTVHSLYYWRRKFLTKEIPKPMAGKRRVPETQEEAEAIIEELKAEVAQLTEQTEDLKKQVYRLNLERSVLERATEILKKGQGISIQTLTNREKAIVINALREQFPLKDLLQFLQIAKSSYCYQVIAMKTDRHCEIRGTIRTVFEESKGRYGYRRIHAVIRANGQKISEKVIRRLMREQNLIVRKVKKKKYNSYIGEISPAVENVINRDFHSEKPNEKWLTDITEFHIPAGKVYLSPIIDCFDGLPVSWAISTSPDSELVNSMLDMAIATLKEDEKPIVHSDRGGHYRWPGWIERMKAAGLTRSMSKKGCSPDNSACEGFFGRLKNELFYGVSWKNVTIDSFIDELDQYIQWYAKDRIKLSLGGMSPLDYRRSLGFLTP